MGTESEEKEKEYEKSKDKEKGGEDKDAKDKKDKDEEKSKDKKEKNKEPEEKKKGKEKSKEKEKSVRCWRQLMLMMLRRSSTCVQVCRMWRKPVKSCTNHKFICNNISIERNIARRWCAAKLSSARQIFATC